MSRGSTVLAPPAIEARCADCEFWRAGLKLPSYFLGSGQCIFSSLYSADFVGRFNSHFRRRKRRTALDEFAQLATHADGSKAETRLRVSTPQ